MNPDHYDTPSLMDGLIFAWIMLRWPLAGLCVVGAVWWLT